MSQPTALPLWSRILSAGHDSVYLAAASIAYARQFAAVAISQRFHNAEVEEREVLQFKEVLPGHDGHDESDDDSVLSRTCRVRRKSIRCLHIAQSAPRSVSQGVADERG